MSSSSFARVMVLLSLASVGLAVPSTAQPPSPPTTTGVLDPSKAPTQYATDTWSMEDGLPQSFVEALAQASDGHLWLGTQEGLARFDGARFEIVDARETDGLGDNTILALAPDADGGVWVGTRNAGLVHIDRTLRAVKYGTEHGLPDLTVADVGVDAQGRIWLGTRAGLCTIKPGDGPDTRFTCYGEEAGLEDPYVRRLLVSEAGELWLGTLDGLFRFQEGRAESQAALGGAAAEPVTALHEDRRGGLWVGSLRGLGHFDGTRLTVPTGTEAFANVEVSSLLEDTAGAVWIGTYGMGLHRLYRGTLEAVTTGPEEDFGTVRALLQDREGSLWIGTMGGGLGRLRDTKFTPFGMAEGVGADLVYSITTAPDGAVWVGTDGGGVAQIQEGRVTRTLSTAEGLPSDTAPLVKATRDGALWIGLDGVGLCRFKDTLACFDEADGLPDLFALALYESRDGTLWVGSDRGLSRWNGQSFERAPGDPEAPVVALAEAADGAFWIGTFGAGLFHYDGELTHYPDLAGEIVLALHARPDGTLWAGTDGEGLVRIARDGSGAFAGHRFTTDEGLSSNAIFQILEDSQERLWMGSNRGIFRIDLADFERIVGGVQSRVQPTTFGRQDGMRSAEVNGGVQPAGTAGTDGSLWFPTAGGVVTIQPESIRSNPLPPPTVVQRVTAQGALPTLGEDGAFKFPPGSEEFEFDYAGLSFFDPSHVEHRYFLEGRDKHWTDAGSRRTAYYTNLAPGNYVFRVQAANNDGVWNEVGGTVAFTLEPHVWQTGWFRVLCVLAALGLGFVGYRGRVRQLRARAEHLERVVEERTQDLVEQKSIVETQAKELAALNRSLEQKVREQLEVILRSSRLRKFFPKKVVDRILNADEDVQVSSERRTITIFFSDLTGFTRLSDTTPPAVVTRLLNEYLNAMVALVDAHGGTLDKFMGDGMMVLFGAVDTMAPEVQAQQAVRMGVAMQQAIDDLTATWAERGLSHPVAIRIGIHQAEVTVGNFGSDDLVEHTAIGAGVNLASRLEGACVPGEVLVSEAVHALSASAFDFGAAQQHQLKGIAEPVTAFPLDPRVSAVPTGDGVAGEPPSYPHRSERR